MRKFFIPIAFLLSTNIFSQSIVTQAITCAAGSSLNSTPGIAFAVGEIVIESTNDSSGVVSGFAVNADAAALTAIKVLSDPNISIKIFPNPTTSVLNIYIDGDNYSVSIYDILGNEVFTSSIFNRKLSIDISHLRVGSYVLNFTNDNHHISIYKIQKLK